MQAWFRDAPIKCKLLSVGLLTPIDNGRGITKNRTDASIPYGILGMSERVDKLGGKINFDTPPGGGFNVTVTLLLPANEEGET